MIFDKKISILIFGLLLVLIPIKASAVEQFLCESKMPSSDYNPPYKEWECRATIGINSSYDCGPVKYPDNATCDAALAKIVKPPKKTAPLPPPAFKAGEGYCLCDTGCVLYGYNNQTELENAKKACSFASCTKTPKQFQEGKKCAVFAGHCDCKDGCVPKTYTNLNEVKAGNEFCASAACSATDKTYKDGGCTPVAEKGSTGPVDNGPTEVKLENPIALGPAGNATDVPTIIGTIINGIMGIMGAIVLLLVVYGGTTWLMSAGNPEKIKSGSQTILWALFGAIITVASYVILSKIMELITTNAY